MNLHVYHGRTMPARKGQPCRIVNTWRRRGPHNVLVEFDDGRRVVTPMRCLRRSNP